MEYIYFPAPPYPHFVIAAMPYTAPDPYTVNGPALVFFDMIYVEYGELFITENDHAYHLKENDILIIRPDTIHFGHNPCTVKTKFMWCHFRTSGTFYYSEEIKLPVQIHKSIHSYEDRTSHLIIPLYKHLSSQELPEFASCFSRLRSSNVDKYQQTEKQTPINYPQLNVRKLSCTC